MQVSFALEGEKPFLIVHLNEENINSSSFFKEQKSIQNMTSLAFTIDKFIPNYQKIKNRYLIDDFALWSSILSCHIHKNNPLNFDRTTALVVLQWFCFYHFSKFICAFGTSQSCGFLENISSISSKFYPLLDLINETESQLLLLEDLHEMDYMDVDCIVGYFIDFLVRQPPSQSNFKLIKLIKTKAALLNPLTSHIYIGKTKELSTERFKRHSSSDYEKYDFSSEEGAKFIPNVISRDLSCFKTDIECYIQPDYRHFNINTKFKDIVFGLVSVSTLSHFGIYRLRPLLNNDNKLISIYLHLKDGALSQIESFLRDWVSEIIRSYVTQHGKDDVIICSLKKQSFLLILPQEKQTIEFVFSDLAVYDYLKTLSLPFNQNAIESHIVCENIKTGLENSFLIGTQSFVQSMKGLVFELENPENYFDLYFGLKQGFGICGAPSKEISTLISDFHSKSEEHCTKKLKTLETKYNPITDAVCDFIDSKYSENTHFQIMKMINGFTEWDTKKLSTMLRNNHRGNQLLRFIKYNQNPNYMNLGIIHNWIFYNLITPKLTQFFDSDSHSLDDVLCSNPVEKGWWSHINPQTFKLDPNNNQTLETKISEKHKISQISLSKKTKLFKITLDQEIVFCNNFHDFIDCDLISGFVHIFSKPFSKSFKVKSGSKLFAYQAKLEV